MLAEDSSPVSSRIRSLVIDLRAEWQVLDGKIDAINGEFIEMAHNDPAARRLTAIPGIGVLNATALLGSGPIKLLAQAAMH